MTNQNNNTIDSLIQVQSYLNELWKGGLPWTANTIKVVNNDDIEMINYVYMSIIKISIMTKIMMIMMMIMIKKMIKIMMPRWCLSSLQCSSVPRYGSSSPSPLTSGWKRICRNIFVLFFFFVQDEQSAVHQVHLPLYQPHVPSAPADHNR